eukprot:761711-Hanusia_phi.AAC.4
MSSFLGRLSQGIGGVSQDEEDINSPIAFSRGRGRPSLSSNVSNFGSTDTGLRRNWVRQRQPPLPPLLSSPLTLLTSPFSVHFLCHCPHPPGVGGRKLGIRIAFWSTGEIAFQALSQHHSHFCIFHLRHGRLCHVVRRQGPVQPEQHASLVLRRNKL